MSGDTAALQEVIRARERDHDNPETDQVPVAGSFQGRARISFRAMAVIAMTTTSSYGITLSLR